VKIDRSTPVLVDRGLLVRVYTDAGIVGTGKRAHGRAPARLEAISERPDSSLAGGFTRVKKIAALAEAATVGIP
jgi:L-alanine-DL-glutamate epimerase-like enolase superfamily enzyme